MSNTHPTPNSNCPHRTTRRGELRALATKCLTSWSSTWAFAGRSPHRKPCRPREHRSSTSRSSCWNCSSVAAWATVRTRAKVLPLVVVLRMSRIWVPEKPGRATQHREKKSRHRINAELRNESYAAEVRHEMRAFDSLMLLGMSTHPAFAMTRRHSWSACDNASTPSRSSSSS